MNKFLIALMLLMNNKGIFDVGGGSEDPNGGEPNGGDPNGGISIEYPEGLDKEYHGNKTLLKYVDSSTGKFKPHEVMKALIHATSHIGSDKMIVPNNKFTDEQWKETFKKLGVPDSLEAYEIKNTLAENQKDIGIYDGFKKIAHEAGILPKQAQKVLDYLNSTFNEKDVNNSKLMDTKYQEEVTGLKTKWGDKFQANLDLAEKGIKKFASDEEIQKLKDQGVLSSPLLTEIFNRVSKGLLEDSFTPEVKGTFSSSPDEIREKIASFYQKDHPFMNKNHPQNAFYKDEYMRMMEQLHGKTPVSPR